MDTRYLSFEVPSKLLVILSKYLLLYYCVPKNSVPENSSDYKYL